MADSGGGGRAPPPRSAPACPREVKSFIGGLVTLLRQMEARESAFAVEHARLLADIEFLERERSQREQIAQDSIQELRRTISLKDDTAKLLEKLEARDPALDEFGDKFLESVRNLISNLTDENTKLKKKLKEIGSQAGLSESIEDHQNSAKDLKAELKKLKKAYKTMVSEKDKEISVMRAENGFVWNQFKSLEKEFIDTCKSKNIEIKRANEAAEEVEKLRLEVQEKDGEIGRLQAEVVSQKEKKLMIENELVKMRSLVKSKDGETDQSETRQKWKKNLETKRKSNLEKPVLSEILRIPHVTPVRIEVKTSRKHVSNAKGTPNQSGNSSRMHNKEVSGKSETSQKRKRGSGTLSHSVQRCSPREQLFTPLFTIPKLSARTTLTPQL